MVLSEKTCITCICTTWRHSQSSGWWCKKTLCCNSLPPFWKLRSLLRGFRYVTNVVFTEGVKFHHFTLNFWTILSAWVVHCIFTYFLGWMHFAHLCTQNIKCLVQKYVIWNTAQNWSDRRLLDLTLHPLLISCARKGHITEIQHSKGCYWLHTCWIHDLILTMLSTFI